ncbi:MULTISPECIES: ABC transporter permease [Bacillus cereus group]|uniref:ABC transporter, permease component, putative sodium exporter n=1 Tax=Bacillus cereus (strain G9842) TaxID=405531 RepID=B7IMA2_BACC2|nr:MULTISPECIES: ABC transporter permease [Bacillus cereus group]ACK95505.1 ABC transporter, permease component, putative sodium exporter [Bacillus cereus G9842]MCU5405618.1 ABC transporter permease [Bacillus cereus]MDR4137706.1 ABC transporter permease [Bacillus cereus]MDR4364594.1 ABC transporter permease [Bacillus cereus]PER82382.1 ABC transporter permease [Bacillus thuringiensis]
MSSFWTIFLQNYKSKVKSKSYFAITIIVSMLIIGLMNFDKIYNLFVGNEDDQVVVVTEKEELYSTIHQVFKNVDSKIQVKRSTDKQKAESGVKNGDYTYAIVVEELNNKQLKATYITETDVNQQDVSKVQTILSQIQSSNFAQQLNLSQDELKVLTTPVEIHTKTVSDKVKDGEHTEGVGILINVFIMLNYLMILMYAAQLATDVATEKSSRVMELVVSSISPTKHLYAKLFSTLLAGITQIIIWGLVATVGYKTAINDSKNDILNSIDLNSVAPTLVFYGILFFTLGFLLYGSLSCLFGSIITRIEESSQAVMPLMFMLLAALYIAIYGMSNPSSMVVTITSYVPFFTPIVMLVRIGFLNIPVWEIALALGILIATICIMIGLTSRVYRGGVLIYGKGAFSNIKKAIKLGQK